VAHRTIYIILLIGIGSRSTLLMHTLSPMILLHETGYHHWNCR
jgi:hypothetical protein